MAAKFPESSSVDSVISSLTGTIAASVIQKATSFADKSDGDASCTVSRLFGRENPVHHVLGGGKSADVLLWRNKTISASFLTSATIVWVLFEWLNYHFLSLMFFLAALGLVVQFLWTASGIKNKAPRLVLSEELFENIGRNVCGQMNLVLGLLQDASCGGNFKQCLTIVGSLMAASVLGSWCNFITVIYLGIVGAHTLPVIYEKYDDQIDGFVMKVFSQLQGQYSKVDSNLVKSLPSEATREIVSASESEGNQRSKEVASEGEVKLENNEVTQEKKDE